MPSPRPQHLCHSPILSQGNPMGERKVRHAVALTAAMMVGEILCGYLFNSMALLADGWHMSSHALALGLAVFAYATARRLAQDGRFTFGTWKIEVLAGYTSALILVGVAVLMLYQSAERLLNPSPISYDMAIFVAIIGLLVNLACAWLLKDDHSHSHDHGHHHGAGHDHDHGHSHHDLNHRAAYLHVVADAATSVLAIVALLGGKYWGAAWLDPLMGVAGAVLVALWAQRLLRDCGRVLLDAEMDAPVVAEIREVIATSPVAATIRDLHVWRVAKDRYACILTLQPSQASTPEYFKQQLAIHEELAHITVELLPA